MTVEIKQDIVRKSMRDRKSYGPGNPRKRLVVHQTGNASKGADAKMHAQYQHNGAGGRAASWHIQSDDKVIIQSYPFNYRCYHASTGDAPNGGNMVAIGWEICINSDGNYIKSLELAAKGIAQVMKQEGIPMSGLVRHHDEDPKKQRCPRQLMDGKDGVTWDKFKAMVQANMDNVPVPKPSQKAPEAPKKASAEQVAQDISVGKGGWGNNPERANKLKAAGYDAKAIQSRVNDILNTKSAPKPSKPSAEQVAKDIANGRGGWGNNPERARKLKAAGYDSKAVQARVNDIFKGKTKASTPIKKPSGPRVGQTVTTRTLYVNSTSTKNVRSSPVKGYIHSINNSWRNPIRLTNGKNGSWLGFTRPGDIL